MGFLRTAALVVLGISAFTFVALFGRLPAFRRTPIAFLHRALWVYIPNGIASADSRLFDGRVVHFCSRSGNYILGENHPLVLIFFVSLLVIGECIFLPSAWPRISGAHRFWVPMVVILPYVLLYACVVTKPFITPENHAKEMKRYPYDRVLFHPGHKCPTCDFLKPARSKHCSFCRACISRHDHHCVWLMNCVGANNYVYFLSLLLSLSVLLSYGSIMGHFLLHQTRDELVPVNMRAAKQNWTTYLNIWSVVIAADPRVGGIFLLMLMTAPLAVAFLAYHTYLIWAGMTTNESAKWSDWKEDVADGLVFKAKRSEVDGASFKSDSHDLRWPMYSDQILVLDADPPTEGSVTVPDSNRVSHCGGHGAAIDTRWMPVHSMRDVDNIYDLGFWDNLRDSVGLSVRKRPQL
ncbi:hypothetical protein NUU61_003003 [Penicillium alfredii]|uniref:Palmitoyltransferase n=1 Tax=Penicillium alfredii TaxID=1506179 RepID=A0A9W9FSJ6_9EURO|nr:uncharacterized protein NUU61_003003 [Penicillium alfredii]KAJ5105656.1 hypothetical protein NUU61_003003 [Penicillium alfredii]